MCHKVLITFSELLLFDISGRPKNVVIYLKYGVFKDLMIPAKCLFLKCLLLWRGYPVLNKPSCWLLDAVNMLLIFCCRMLNFLSRWDRLIEKIGNRIGYRKEAP